MLKEAEHNSGAIRQGLTYVKESVDSHHRRTEKLTLKWSDRKSAPETMWRGAAIVQRTIVYVIGRGTHTTYSYQIDSDTWSKHSECPLVNSGFVIINDLLTAVGGKEEDCCTNKLVSFNSTEWVEQLPPMHTAREDPAVVHYGNYVIVMGGDKENNGVELLNIPSLLWSTVTCLPSPLKCITATLCHDDIIAMDWRGSAYMMNIDLLISSMQMKESSTEFSEWTPLPKCPVDWRDGPSLITFHGQTIAVSYNGLFQLRERQWVKIGDMSVPMYGCIVCVVCDQVVVVGGCPPFSLTRSDAVRMAIIL